MTGSGAVCAIGVDIDDDLAANRRQVAHVTSPWFVPVGGSRRSDCSRAAGAEEERT
jgi:hypothetical protein